MKKHFFLTLFTLFLINMSAQHFNKSKELPPECKRCHECNEPTKMNPCLKACPREHMITVHHTPEEGPDVIVIDQFGNYSKLYEPVSFSHRAHAEMSGMGGECQICHHFNPPGNILPCRECHELTRIREDINKPDLKAAYHRQCISCHREWSGEVECLSCHAPEGEADKIKTHTAKVPGERVHPKIIEPAKLIYKTEFDENDIVTFFHNEHTDLFGLECTSCHQNESCSKCHMKAELKPAEASVESKHLLCSDCHDTDDNCDYCHRESEMEPFNHSIRTGFALKGYHADLSCQKCHKVRGKFAGLSSDCALCHQEWSLENFDHAVTALILDETHTEFECDNCHSEGYGEKPVCDNCHDDDIKYPDSVPGRKN